MRLQIPSMTAAVIVLAASPALGDVVTFDDLTLGDVYTVGDVFTSDGVQVVVESFFWSDGTEFAGGQSSVMNGGLAGGAGLEMGVNNSNLRFEFGVELTNLSLQFGEYGGNLNLEVNGDFQNFQNFQDVDGAVIGGATVSVINGFGNDAGMLSIVGAINDFHVGGQELWIDNLEWRAVPAPGAMALMALAGLASRRRRR